MAGNDGTVKLYNVSVDDKPYLRGPSKETHEYQRSLEVSTAPDTFPCGHVLCHKCLRKHLMPYKRSAWCCPVCDREASTIHVPEYSASVSGSNDRCDHDDSISFLSNYEEIVKKFNGINYLKYALKKEKVQSRSVGMTYTKVPCSLCEENHGTLKVVQEHSFLGVNHVRPPINPYFYRLHTGNIVTTFYSKVNSSCVCVPCTYREIHEHPDQFPNICGVTNNNELDKIKPENALADVGKLITDTSKNIGTLQGKNVLELEHRINVRERADRFDFDETTKLIKKMVSREQKNLIKYATMRMKDTGRMYHIQESSTVDYDKDETVV